jgi:hypothetical protein
MPNITPDLSQNILVTLYFLFTHNYIVFMYFTGLILSVILSIKHPSRYATFLIIGFALLTFSYEYDKHIVDGLRTQTLNSLITINRHYTIEKYINIIIGVIAPIVLYITGWIFVFIALVTRAPNSPSSKEHKSL